MSTEFAELTRSEQHTPFYCIHPYFGYVCRPNAVLDFSDTLSEWVGHGAHATIDWEGFRNQDRPRRKPANEIWIGLFGGSVAFSFPSTNNSTTIASYLERALNGGRSTSDRRVRVLNFALPAGQQPQQAIIFLTHAKDLDGIITFDGVNEAIIAPYFQQGLIPDEFPIRPTYEALCARTLSDEQAGLSWALEDAEREVAQGSRVNKLLRIVERRRIDRLRRRLRASQGQTATLRSLFGIQDLKPDRQTQVDAGVRRWHDAIKSMNAMALAWHVSRLFVLQPVPEQSKDLTDAEREGLDQYPDMGALRASGYPQLESSVSALQNEGIPCMSFKDVFKRCAETIYTDHIHFDDRGCEIVAARLAETVRDQWPCLS
jgi:hypothetical protein